MRRFLSWICLIAALCILPAAILARRVLPVDTQALVEKKYDGWSGVLRAWVCSDWSCESSFIRWLDRCADSFERDHDGVYLEFAFVEAHDLNELYSADVPPPELVFFSPGAMRSAERMTDGVPASGVRAGLQVDSRAVPVAMGGCICVCNPSAQAQSFVIPPERADAVPYIIEETPAEIPLPTEEPGVDLGLPALAQSGYAVSETAFEDFIDGKIMRTVVTQKELSRLIALKDSGRGPDWKCEISGTRTLCDQLLLAAVPQTDAAREEIARTFVEHLLKKESQTALGLIGAFGVTDAVVYPEFSDYAPMETLLRTRSALVPPAFGGAQEFR